MGRFTSYTKRWPNVKSSQRLERWLDVAPALCRRIVFQSNSCNVVTGKLFSVVQFIPLGYYTERKDKTERTKQMN